MLIDKRIKEEKWRCALFKSPLENSQASLADEVLLLLDSVLLIILTGLGGQEVGGPGYLGPAGQNPPEQG